MTMKSLLSAGLGAIALGLATTAAQAEPAGVLAAAVERDTALGGLVEQVHWYGDYDRPYYRYRSYRPYYYYRHYRPYYRFHGNPYYRHYGHRYW